MTERKIFSYDEAFNKSLDYFNGDELASKVWVDKYCLRNNDGNLLEDSPAMMHHRIAKEFARIEAKKFKKPLNEEEIFSLLDHFNYILPQGSPMFGIGNDYQTVSLSNCFLLDVPLDSYSSILQVDEQLVSISKRRGGVGIDLSNLRPAGTPTRNAARSSSGITTWMERYSRTIREVGQEGRRGALMLTLSIHHPEIENFITIKNDPSKVTGANISVRLTDEFLNAVRKDKEYELRFPIDYKEKGVKPTISKQIKAREIWKLIIHSAWLRAEPGILQWNNVQKNTPADCYERFASRGVNPCAELVLSQLDSCRLLVLNLLSYVLRPFTKDSSLDFLLFHRHAKIAQRLMDDLVDLESEKIDQIIKKIESDPEPLETKANELNLWKKIKKNNDEGRRTGTGITALGDTLAALGIEYGSPQSIKIVEQIYRALKLACYESSVDMAEELGTFVGYDAKKEESCPFIQRIKEDDSNLYDRMTKVGRRNVSLTTTAPGGSISILTRTTSGIEPLFMLGYTRRKKVNPMDKNARVDFVDERGDKWQEFMVYHPTITKWMEITGEKDVNKSPWFGCCAEDIDWVNRVKLQAVAQKHICHSISSTINLPENVKEEEVAKIYETAFESGCKGLTVYRKGCRDGVLIEKKEGIKKTTAPKRPKELSGEVHHFVTKGVRHFVIVGLLNNDPYEIFSASNHDHDGEIIIPKNISKGLIIKNSRGDYRLHSDGKEYVILNGNADSNIEVVTRLVSTALRHGTDISFVTHQLEKTRGEMQSFAKVLARTLKKYIKDGTEVTGEKCPECKRNDCKLVREDGCVKCVICGWTKCS